VPRTRLETTPARILAAIGVASVAATTILAQTPGGNGPKPGLAFDVASIKINSSEDTFGSLGMLPDGTFRLVNSGLSNLISAAYPGMAEYVGIPEWAQRDRYDVTAKTSVAKPSPEDRAAMMQALLEERFRFVAHVETREKPTFDLVLARQDGQLGKGMTPTDVDCDTPAARAAAVTTTPPDSNVPACLWTMTGEGFEGDVTMASLASSIRTYAGRHVFDKSGLTGRYRVKLVVSLFGRELGATDIDSPTTIFTALTEQLGLKLQSSRAPLDVLVIDRMERPTEN